LYVLDVTNIHKILQRRLFLRGQVEDRFPFTEHVPFSALKWEETSLSFGELTSAKGFTIEKEFSTVNLQLRGSSVVVLTGVEEFLMG
jgi:hypothetical protein